MKKFIKSAALVCLFVFIISGVYVVYTLRSSGTADIHYIEPEDQYHSLQEVLGHPELQDKVVYVDFWHTGCSPCLEEFTHIPQLKDQFHQEGDLAFLYLGKDRSVPGEKFRWKRVIEKKDLKGYHFFMSDELYYKIWDEAVNDTTILQAFPHYLIVNRSGEIINKNAPRPSNPALPGVLRETLSVVD